MSTELRDRLSALVADIRGTANAKFSGPYMHAKAHQWRTPHARPAG